MEIGLPLTVQAGQPTAAGQSDEGAGRASEEGTQDPLGFSRLLAEIFANGPQPDTGVREDGMEAAPDQGEASEDPGGWPQVVLAALGYSAPPPEVSLTETETVTPTEAVDAPAVTVTPAVAADTASVAADSAAVAVTPAPVALAQDGDGPVVAPPVVQNQGVASAVTPQAPASQAPATQAPVSEAPASQAPATQAPTAPAQVSQAPAPQATVSQAPASVGTTNAMGSEGPPLPPAADATEAATLTAPATPEPATPEARDHDPPVAARMDARPAVLDEAPEGASQPVVPSLGQAQGGRLEQALPRSELAGIDRPVTVEQLFDKLVSHARLHRGPESAVVHLRLHPEHLGRVEIRLNWQGQALTAQFLVERPEARLALEANLSQLQAALREEGVDVAGLGVALGRHSAFARRDEEGWSDPADRLMGRRRASVTVTVPETAISGVSGYGRWSVDGTSALDYRV